MDGCFGGGGRGPERVGGGSNDDLEVAMEVEEELLEDMERDESVEMRLCGEEA